MGNHPRAGVGCGDVAEDGGYSRASLPFTLEERNANCMHNGVLTFLFKSDGTHLIGRLAGEQ